MININMFGGWWQNHPGNPANKAKEPDAKEPIAKNCVFCTKPLCEGDTYWIGRDRHKILAITCTGHKCVQWLKWKAKRKVPWTL